MKKNCTPALVLNPEPNRHSRTGNQVRVPDNKAFQGFDLTRLDVLSSIGIAREEQCR